MRDRCLRVLLELPDGLDEAETVATADRLLAAVADLGLHTRIGLEDTLVLPDGRRAADNAALVRAAAAWSVRSNRR